MAKKKTRRNRNTKVICPYCRSEARLVPASEVIKHETEINYLYKCSNPECDAYVAAHNNTLIPMGPLANSELRKLRLAAHLKFDQIWKRGIMTKPEAYRWLAASLSMKCKDAHIGQFAEHYCKQTIALAEQVLENHGGNL